MFGVKIESISCRLFVVLCLNYAAWGSAFNVSRSPGQQQRKSVQVTATSTTLATTTSTTPATTSTTPTPTSTTSTTATTSTRGILLKQKSIERYSPEPTGSTSSTYKDTGPLFHLAKPSSPSDRESESGNSTSRASPVKPRSVNSDYDVDDICVTINLTESENETSQAIPIKDDRPVDKNETMTFPSSAAAAKKQTDEIESETQPLNKSAVVEIPEVTFDEKGQTWDVYGAEFDPEILGQAIQHHLEKIMERKFKEDEPQSKHPSPEEQQTRSKKPRVRSEEGKEYFKLYLLQRHDSAGMDINNAASPGDNRYLHDDDIDDMSNNNHICRDSSDPSDNASTSDNESLGDNVGYRRRFTNLISRYLCSLVGRRGHAQSVSWELTISSRISYMLYFSSNSLYLWLYFSQNILFIFLLLTSWGAFERHIYVRTPCFFLFHFVLCDWNI